MQPLKGKGSALTNCHLALFDLPPKKRLVIFSPQNSSKNQSEFPKTPPELAQSMRQTSVLNTIKINDLEPENNRPPWKWKKHLNRAELDASKTKTRWGNRDTTGSKKRATACDVGCAWATTCCDVGCFWSICWIISCMSRSASQSSSSCSQPAACSSNHTLDGSDGDWPAEQPSKAWPATTTTTTKMRVMHVARGRTATSPASQKLKTSRDQSIILRFDMLIFGGVHIFSSVFPNTFITGTLNVSS